ncbi:hypothetical protein [Agathobacter sp.]|uniref:hypothetical protein n=1 Tax=Agathobacter sp. TaxID=2021311 RepID=UPI003AEFAC31
MRLIDADKITSGEIAKYLGRGYEFCAPDIEDMLREQPTAFDVEKVIEQLNELLEEKTTDSGDDWYTAECLSKAIEIVKRGGRDEDYWK